MITLCTVVLLQAGALHSAILTADCKLAEAVGNELKDKGYSVIMQKSENSFCGEGIEIIQFNHDGIVKSVCVAKTQR